MRQAEKPEEVLSNPENYTHAVVCGSSKHINLPDNSVNAVITDPPYGSNVQYGELSSFWIVWLQDELPYVQNPTNLEHEVLTHRKTKTEGYVKSLEDYYEGLHHIFKECFRILKEGAPLVFTFNNKNLHTWYAVI